ncbi:MAG: hypothetical protein ACE5JA_06135 [bacterium]
MSGVVLADKEGGNTSLAVRRDDAMKVTENGFDEETVWVLLRLHLEALHTLSR